MTDPTNQKDLSRNDVSRRTMFGVTAGAAGLAAASPALATGFRPAAFGAPSEAFPSGISAVEILSDEIVGLVRKRRLVNTSIDKLKATVAYRKKRGADGVADPFDATKALRDSSAVKASLGLTEEDAMSMTPKTALSKELVARWSIDEMLREKMHVLKSIQAEDASLASLQMHTLEGARTEMLVAV